MHSILCDLTSVAVMTAKSGVHLFHHRFCIGDDTNIGRVKIVDLGGIYVYADQLTCKVHAFNKTVSFRKLGTYCENDVRLRQ